MSSWSIIWNRVNGFCFRTIQVTILETLSKQSRKRISFHTISEAATSPITLDCILMDSGEDPTFFKKSSIPCVTHTKHCTLGNSFWISTKAPLHDPSIDTPKTPPTPISLMCCTMRSVLKSIVFSSPIVSMEVLSVWRDRTPMMMFTMGWWVTEVHPS